MDSLRELLVSIEYRDMATPELSKVDKKVDNVRDGFTNMGASVKETEIASAKFGDTTKKTTKNISKLGAGTESTKIEVEDLDKTIRDSSDNTSKSIDRVNQKHKLWKLTANKTAFALKKNKKESQALKDKVKILDTEIGKSNTLLDETKRKYGENSKEAQKLEDHILGLKVQQAELNKELKNFNVNNITEGLNKIGDKMGQAGKWMTTRVTLPLAGVGAAAVKTNIEMEDAFSGVKKTVKGTPEQLKEIKDAMDELTTSSLPINRKELYGIAETAGQLGIERPDIVPFSETMGKIGKITNLSYEEGAAGLARFANITNMSMSDIEKLGSTIVHLDSNLATSANEIVNMALRLASAGNQAGLTEADIMGMAGALSSLGLEAEGGGSAMSKVMLDMTKEVASGGKKLEKYASIAGKSASEFSKQFKEDGAGAISEFVLGLGRLKKEGKDVTSIIEDLGFNELRSRDALLRLTDSGDLFVDSIGKANKAWNENTALNETFEERTDNTAAKLELLRNKWSLMKEKLADTAMPYLDRGIDKIGELVDKFNSLNPATQETIVKIGAIVAAIGPALLIGKTLTKGISKVIGFGFNAFGMLKTLGGGFIKLGGFIKPLLGGFAKLGFGMFKTLGGGLVKFAGFAKPLLGGLFTPWGLAIAGAITAGIALYKNWDTITEKAGELKEKTKEKFAEIGNNISETWGNIKASTSETWNNIKESIGNKTTEIKSSISDKWNSIYNKTSETWNNIKENTSTSWQAIKDKVDEHGGGIKGIIGTLSETCSDLWGKALGKMDSITGGKFSSMANKVGESFKKITDSISSGIDKIKEWNKAKIQPKVASVKEKFQSVGEKARSIGQNAVGTNYWKGGLTELGERGPELVIGRQSRNLPQGYKVKTANETKKILNTSNNNTQVAQSDTFSPVINVYPQTSNPKEIANIKKEVERQLEPMLENYFYKLKKKRLSMN